MKPSTPSTNPSGPRNQAQAQAQAGHPAVTRVLLVGHCGFDSGHLTHAVQSLGLGLSVYQAHRADDLDRYRQPDCLWLVNRALDSGLGAPDGVSLIRAELMRDHPPRLLLISNYPDAQRLAVEAGAWPGVGKSELRDPAALARLRAAVCASPAK